MENDNSALTSKPKETNKVKPNDFVFQVPLTEEQDDDYEKILEKEIEDQCQFKAYIDKLELVDKTDEELLSSTKEDILSFKNKQIMQLKVYIASLEQEKEDLIDNFKETTSLLLEKIKDIEFQSKGVRPETPMITKNLSRKSGGVQKEDFKSLKPQKAVERCPNCTLEFPKDQFLAHSLQCLRKAFNCKVCNELVHESNKMNHLNNYRSPQAMLQAINDNNTKAFQLGIDHGYQVNAIIDKDKEEAIIHLLAKGKSTALMNILLKHQSVKVNLLNKNKETPLIVAIEHKNEVMAKLLLEMRVDFKIRNKGDMSPLMLSCKYGLATIVDLLLTFGADINEKNILGETPLKITQIHNQEALELMLLKRNNPNIKLKKKII